MVVTDLFGTEVAPRKKPVMKREKILTPEPKPERQPVYVEVVKLSPHYSVTYAKEITGFFSGRSNQPKFNKPDVKLSDRARRRLGSALNWLVLFSTEKRVFSKKEPDKSFKFRINFLTLTLSGVQVHDDHYIKQHLLAPFLKWMERSHGCHSYIWKAEAQANGNIHFHITTNQFIHWKAVRGKWNRLLAAHGYCKVFQDGTNDKGNAATQIKAVKSLNGIVSYMQKYICEPDLHKDELSESCPLDDGLYTKKSYWQIKCQDGKTIEYKRPIQGKHWSTSQNLAKINCFISMEDGGQYWEAAGQLLAKSKVLFADQFLTVRKHDVLRSRNMHPLFLNRLKEVKEKHFPNNLQPKKIEIESFY